VRALPTAPESASSSPHCRSATARAARAAAGARAAPARSRARARVSAWPPTSRQRLMWIRMPPEDRIWDRMSPAEKRQRCRRWPRCRSRLARPPLNVHARTRAPSSELTRSTRRARPARADASLPDRARRAALGPRRACGVAMPASAAAREERESENAAVSSGTCLALRQPPPPPRAECVG